MIHLKLFFDIVPSPSANITRAFLGQPKRLLETAGEQMAGTSSYNYVLISFYSRDFFCTLSRLFIYRAFVCFVRVWLFIFWRAVYSMLGSFIKQSLTVTATSTMAVYACVLILCSFLWRCLQMVTKQQRGIATFYIFERKWTVRGQFLKFLFRSDLMLSYLFCLGYFWHYRGSIDKLNEFKFSQDS